MPDKLLLTEAEEDEFEEESLCCCEYISDLTGERSHLLGFCCDCDALDDSFESVLVGRQPIRAKQIWPTFKDRMRIPWFGGSGARRVICLDEPITVIPFLVVPCFAFLATIGPVSTFLSFFFLFIILFCLRKRLRGSKFYLSFLVASAVYAFLVFQLEVVPTLELITYIGNLALLFSILFTIWIIRRIHFRTRISPSLSTKVNLLPAFCYCRTCQTFIEGRDHHCVWLGCCIGVKNRYWFIAALSLFSLWLVWTITLFHKSLYLDSNNANAQIIHSDSVLLEATKDEDGDDDSVFQYFYKDFHSSIRVITMIFGSIVLLLVLAILIHQYRMMMKGMSYLEWKYLEKVKKSQAVSSSTSTASLSASNE